MNAKDQARRMILIDGLTQYLSKNEYSVHSLPEPVQVLEQRLYILNLRDKLYRAYHECANRSSSEMIVSPTPINRYRRIPTDESRKWDGISRDYYEQYKKVLETFPEPKAIPFISSLERAGETVIFLSRLIGKPTHSYTGAKQRSRTIAWKIQDEKKLEKVIMVLLHNKFTNFAVKEGVVIRTLVDAQPLIFLKYKKEDWQTAYELVKQKNQEKREIKAVVKKIDGK